MIGVDEFQDLANDFILLVLRDVMRALVVEPIRASNLVLGPCARVIIVMQNKESGRIEVVDMMLLYRDVN